MVWLSWLGTVLMSLAYGGLALYILAGIAEWAANSTLAQVMDMSEDLIGVVGTCAILVFTLAFFILFSLFALCMKLCSKNDVPGFRYGMLTGTTFFMIFICLTSAFVIESSKHLVVANQIKLDDVLPNSTQTVDGTLNEGETWDTIKENTKVLLSEDDTIWYATVISGYVTAVLYLILFFWFLMYQFAAVCGCCAEDDDEDDEDVTETAEPVKNSA